MATVCSFCGKELPQGGNAQFCIHCGKLVPNDPLSDAPNTQVVMHNTLLTDNNKAPLSPNIGWHEQLAMQPRPFTPHPFIPSETPSAPDIEDVATLSSQTQNSTGSEPDLAPLLEDFPTSIMPASGVNADDDVDVEDLPTASFSSTIVADQAYQEQSESLDQRQDEDIDQMPTAHIQNVVPSPLPTSSLPTANVSEPASAPDNIASMPRQPVGTLDRRHFGTQAIRASAPRKQKRSLLVGVVAAIVLLVLAVACWIILAQPFTVASATDFLQTTSSASLGLTITYPAGWIATQTSTALTLDDSSNVAEMKVTQSASGNTDQASYLKQQAAKLNMTDAKAGPSVSFAGSSWQQIKGDYLVSGAGYIGTIYITTHNNHFYTLTQVAPKVTFQDEESLVFTPARASLKFT